MNVLTEDTDIRQVVPKDVRDLDASLGLFMYSNQDDRDKLPRVTKKRGRKPRASDLLHELIPKFTELE